MKLLWINPTPKTGDDSGLLSYLDSALVPDADLEIRHIQQGPHHLEYAYYGAYVTMQILDEVRGAEEEDFDGAVIGCFYDPALIEAREIARRLTITAPMEASISIAHALGDRFSILVGRQKWVPFMRERLRSYGLESRLASFRPVELGVLDFHSDEQRSKEALLEQGAAALEEDNAEVLILGCTATYGFYEQMQAELSVPVVDPVLASVQYVQMLARARANHGWSHSKLGIYESPPGREIDDWGLI